MIEEQDYIEISPKKSLKERIIQKVVFGISLIVGIPIGIVILIFGGALVVAIIIIMLIIVSVKSQVFSRGFKGAKIKKGYYKRKLSIISKWLKKAIRKGTIRTQ